MKNKYEVAYLKLNTDPDVSDLGIISFSVIVECADGEKIEDVADTHKGAVNGMDNEAVLLGHRVNTLDDFENIAIRTIKHVSDNTPLGINKYFYRTDVKNNIVHEIVPGNYSGDAVEYVNKVLVINTGGTFNKEYDKSKGEHVIPENISTIENIVKNANIENINIRGTLFKDDSDLTDADRHALAGIINNTSFNKIIVIIGTDDMGTTAEYLSDYVRDKVIILTGAMIPAEVIGSDAASNFMMSYGYAQVQNVPGVYIGMSGIIDKSEHVFKDTVDGRFYNFKDQV